MKNILYYYMLAAIVGVLVEFNYSIGANKQVLDYSVKHLLLIELGGVMAQMTALIFPVLIAGILFNFIRKKIQQKRIGNLMTHGLKTKLLISVLFTVLVLAYHIYVFKLHDAYHIVWMALFAFFSMLLMLSAFLGIFKELLPALDNGLQSRNFSGRSNSGRGFNRNRNSGRRNDSGNSGSNKNFNR